MRGPQVEYPLVRQPVWCVAEMACGRSAVSVRARERLYRARILWSVNEDLETYLRPPFWWCHITGLWHEDQRRGLLTLHQRRRTRVLENDAESVPRVRMLQSTDPGAAK